jgi:hypothetical protein
MDGDDNWLLVFDDIDDHGLLETYLPQKWSGAHDGVGQVDPGQGWVNLANPVVTIIITSRRDSCPWTNYGL